MSDAAMHALKLIWSALGGEADGPGRMQFVETGDLPSVFAVSDLAAASVGAACLAMAELVAARHGAWPQATVDRRLASLWFGASIRPQGWKAPAPWDAVAGDYRTGDGWIRLHTNAPHHRAAALAVLDAPADRAQVARAVQDWQADALETAVTRQGGCAAAMRSLAAWAGHPQGQAVAAEPLLIHRPGDVGPMPNWPLPQGRPLQGVRILDMTRVLAGPVATRFLAGFGAAVLRIDPPDWNEPSIVPDLTLGKRCARLDLRQRQDRATWEGLLRQADVLVHGYRPGALTALGLGIERRRALCPDLIDVSLDAYGWSGPWAGRRGFDSLIQMSAGIADAGMRGLGRDQPTPLPVQALDHATGYLMAAAVVRGLKERLTTGMGYSACASLARTASFLISLPVSPAAHFRPEEPDDFATALEVTPWGAARRLTPPCRLQDATMHWSLPATDLGSSPAAWPA